MEVALFMYPALTCRLVHNVATGEHFVVAGLNRLTVPVVKGLRIRRPDADVVVVATTREQVYRPMLVGPGVKVLFVEAGLDGALRGPEVDLANAACLLALADSDLDNMRAAVICHSVSPDVPIVLRVFDRVLSDQLEQFDAASRGHALNVRRAYSMSALSAPKFIAAALGQTRSHLLTMRFAEGEVPFLALSATQRSPLAEKSVQSIERESGCAVIAQKGPDGSWGPAPSDDAIVRAGDTVVIAGPETNVFRLASKNEPLVAPKVPSRALTDRGRRRPSGDDSGAMDEIGVRRRVKNITLLPRVAFFLTLVTVASMAVVITVAGKRPIDGFYWMITAAASGAPADNTPQTWLKIFAALPIVAGGALAGVVFSYLASVATTQRLEQRMGRQARRMKGHIVLGGLGSVGYRVERLLWRIGVPTVVIDLSDSTDFAAAVHEHAPVLQGDVRLASNLERAGIRTATCLIAVTDDDLVNLEACMTARTLNPGIKTVARIFDDALAEQGHDAFGVDECFAAVTAATPAFVDAATDPLAIRGFNVNGTGYRAFRYLAGSSVSVGEMGEWRAQGLRIVAFRHGLEGLRPASALNGPLQAGDSAIVAGPGGLIDALATSGRLPSPVA
jgi:Trk K+ transport system NAD-binding subunit